MVPGSSMDLVDLGSFPRPLARKLAAPQADHKPKNDPNFRSQPCARFGEGPKTFFFFFFLNATIIFYTTSTTELLSTSEPAN